MAATGPESFTFLDGLISQSVPVLPGQAGTLFVVDFVTTSNDSLSGLAARDGHTPGNGEFALVTGQTSAAANGIYEVGPTWVRASNYAADADLVIGQQVKVLSGTLGAGSRWELASGTTIAGAKTYALVPVQPVNNARPGVLPLLSRGAHAIPCANSTGDGLVHSKERVKVASYTAITGSDNAAIQAAINAAAATHCHVQLENKQYTGLTYIDAHGTQGVQLHGVGGPAFATDGTGFVFSGGPGGDITGASSSTVTVGGIGDFTLTKSFTIETGRAIVIGAPIKFTSGAGTIWGIPSSYNGGTGVLVLTALASSGSGSSSSWTYVATTRPSIDFRSTIGCGIVGVQVSLPAAHLHRVIDTSWYNPSAPSDSSHFYCKDVGITGGTKGTADAVAWHFYFGTTQALLCESCRSTSAMVGYTCGNGTSTFESCVALDYNACGFYGVSAEMSFNSCTLEPGTSIGGTTDRLIRGIVLGPNSFGVASITNCVFNDANAGAVGYWVDVNGMSTVTLTSNEIQSDATQAPIRIRNSTANGGLGLYGNVFNGCVHGVDCTGTTSPVQTILKAADNDYAGNAFMVGTAGTDYLDFVDESSPIQNVSSTVQGYGLKRNFASFFKTFSTYGLITPATPIDLSIGVDMSFSSTHIYNSYAGGSGTLSTIVSADDGLEIELTHTQAQRLTLKNDYSTGSAGGGYRTILTGTGADIILPAASSAAPITVRLRYKHFLGKWVVAGLFGVPLPSAAPTALADASATIHAIAGTLRTIAATTANRAITLGTTGAYEGMRWRIVRYDSSAFTWTFTDGGSSGDTTVFPASTPTWSEWQFTGGAWLLIGW